MPSFREIEGYHKLGNSVVSVNLPLKTDVGCVGKILKVNDDPQAVGKSTRVTDDSQEEVTARKSTRLRKLPTIRKQDFYGKCKS
jgi:hypothetical protein